MSVDTLHYRTFKAGSKTYFNSSLFFPENVRKDVFALYGFVRVADDFVDGVPQDRTGFLELKRRYDRALAGHASGDPIVDSFVDLLHRREFEHEWVEAFLSAMNMDLYKKEYDDLEETLQYIYGSAEVIGLFMARILDLPEDSLWAARMQGRAMQYINFIRDIDEDVGLGRRYLPLEDSGLSSLDRDSAHSQPDAFKRFVELHLGRYRMWQEEAETGYGFIPTRYLIPIKTASDMYNWTAHRIGDDPFVIFRQKVKPAKSRILLQVLKNAVGV